MRKGERRNYAQSKLKPFRFDKKYPQRVKHTAQYDLGDRKLIREDSSPIVTTRETIVPDEPSGKWEVILNQNCLLVKRAKDSGKIFIWVQLPREGYTLPVYVTELTERQLADSGLSMLKGAKSVSEVLNRVVKGKRYVHWRLDMSRFRGL
jgi:hypothetical protein